MNREQYFASLSAWKQAYSEHTICTRELKQQLKLANQAFSTHCNTLPKSKWGIEYKDRDQQYYDLASKLYSAQGVRSELKAKARESLEQRQVLKQHAIDYWANTKRA